MDRARRQERDRRSGQERRQEQERDRDRRSGQERRQEQERDRRSGQERRQEQERDRRSGQERRALDRVRDQAKIRQLANRWRTMEEEHPRWSHAFERHVDITDQQLARRADTGELPNGKVEATPRNATKWRSADAMVVAADGLAHSKEYDRKLAFAKANGEDRFEVTRPLPEVLGPGWRADVHGRAAASHGVQASQWNDDSIAVGRWRRQSDGRWHLLTCYPQPGE
jgi:hypothetical protein